MKPALVVFGRAPELGKVKSRLAGSIGEEAALAVYSKLLENTLSASSQTGKALFLFGEGEWGDRLPAGWNYQAQQGEGLGERMFFCFHYLFDLGYDSVVLIGTDIDGMNTSLLNAAFEELHRHDAVLGRASDGGYYLIGMNRPHPELFKDMVWSREDVYAETCARANLKGLIISSVGEMHDIDTLEDLQRSSVYNWFRHNFAGID